MYAAGVGTAPAEAPVGTRRSSLKLARMNMEPMRKPHIIVVGVDYSETGALAFERALEAASTHPGAELHVVHVLTSLVALADPLAGAAPQAPFSLQEATEQADRYVKQRCAEFLARSSDKPAVPVIRLHVRFSEPAEQLAQLAADLEADLIVVGTHGRRGLSRVLLGSVAEGTVRLAPCPVLVVRPKQIPLQPQILPPCPECVKARAASKGSELWCAQHSERHGQRHTYYQMDRASSDGGFPLVTR